MILDLQTAFCRRTRTAVGTAEGSVNNFFSSGASKQFDDEDHMDQTARDLRDFADDAEVLS